MKSLMFLCFFISAFLILESSAQNYGPPAAPAYGELGCCRSDFPGNFKTIFNSKNGKFKTLLTLKLVIENTLLLTLNLN